MAYASVSLLKAQDSTLIKGSITEDKTVLNTENIVLAEGNNALEILQKLPG